MNAFDYATASDDALLVAAAGGDSVAMTELVKRLTPSLMAYFVTRTRSAEAAEELTQATIIRVWRYARHYAANRERWGNGNVWAWTVRVARGVLLNTVRAASRDAVSRAIRVTTDGVDAVSLAPARAEAEYSDGCDRIMEHVARLPKSQAAAFKAVHIQGHTVQAAAVMLGVPTDTIRSRVRLAVDKLRSMLSHDPAFAAFA